MKRAIIALIVAAAVIVGAVAIYALSSSTGSKPAATIPPVKAGGDVVADAVVEPVRKIDLAFPVSGTVAEVAVEDGAVVKAGTLLARLDDRIAQQTVAAAQAQANAAQAQAAAAGAAVTQASAAVTRANATLTEAKAGLAQARALLDAAKAARDALPSGAPDAQIRAADAQVAAATAAVNAASAKVSEATAAVSEANAALAAARENQDAAQAQADAAKAQLVQAQVALDQLRIVAPYDGTVVDAIVVAGQQVTPAIPIVRYADLSVLQVTSTDLDEVGAGRISVGLPVELTFDALPGVKVSGRVRSIALSGQPLQGQVNFQVVVTPDEIPAGLRWGMTASMTVKVPSSASPSPSSAPAGSSAPASGLAPTGSATASGVASSSPGSTAP